MSAQIRRREPDPFPQVITPHDRPQDRVLTAQHFSGFRQVACFDCMTNRCTAYELTVPECYRGNSNDRKVELRAQLTEESKIAAPDFTKCPFMPHPYVTTAVR